MNPQQPTAAAMRAAKTIADASGLSSEGIVRDAEIIDRETGLPEIIAAARELTNSVVGISAASNQMLDRLEKALRKAENE